MYTSRVVLHYSHNRSYNIMKETRQQRKDRQLQQHIKMVEELEQDIAQMYKRKVQRDCYYINYKNIVEECI